MITRRLFNTPDPWWGWSNPFDELERIRRQMNSLLEEPSRKKAGVFPLINITEDKDNYRVRAELPGLTTDDLDISVTGNSLSLSGERKIPTENNNAKYHRREREAGKFSRIINLPSLIDVEKIEAKLLNGVLSILLPKSEIAKPRQISVK